MKNLLIIASGICFALSGIAIDTPYHQIFLFMSLYFVLMAIYVKLDEE